MTRSELAREYAWRQSRLDGADWAGLPDWAREMLEQQNRHVAGTEYTKDLEGTLNEAASHFNEMSAMLSCIKTDFLEYVRVTTSEAKAAAHRNVLTNLKAAVALQKKTVKALEY